jgi:hypothetical protein
LGRGSRIDGMGTRRRIAAHEATYASTGAKWVRIAQGIGREVPPRHPAG